MKIFYTLLLSIFCCISNLQSQHVFYDQSVPISISEDPTTLVVHLQNLVDFKLFGEVLPDGWQILKKIEKYQAYVIKSPWPLESSFSVKDIEGMDVVSVRDETHAFELSDGFDLYLSFEMLTEPRPGVDLVQVLEQKFSHYNAVVRRNQFDKYIVTLDSPKNTLLLANELVSLKLVEWAHPNFYANHEKSIDPLYADQFQMNNTGQSISGVSGSNDIDCDAPQAWGISTGSGSIKVAILDDGLENHPDLNQANGLSKILGGFTPVNDGNGSPTADSDHGMACAGIVAASHNSIGIRGMAPGVKLRSVNIFFGGETTSDLADAFTWAKNNGVDVISNSWSYSSCILSLSALNAAIDDARDNGRNGKGCVVVFAAGNNYNSCIDYPADLPGVLCVGAVTNTGNHSNYSNTGPEMDVVAPSNGAPGQSGAGVRTIDRIGSAGYSFTDYYSGFGGTSAACPLVAGVAALVLSVDGTLTELEVRELLENTASNMGPAGFDDTYGHGRVSAYDALLDIGSTPPPPPVINCTSTVTSFPYLEGFEASFGAWSQGSNEDFDWSRTSGGTPSSNTGPVGADQGSNYIYIESSAPNYPNKSATLISPCFNLTSISNPAFAFSYNMNGMAIGTLKVEVSTNGLAWSQVWSISGNQGNDWIDKSINLNSFTNSSQLKIRITASTTNNFTGDIALDAFYVGQEQSAVSVGCSDVVSTFPYVQSFESSTGDWQQILDDDINWTSRAGGTPSSGTGPTSASSGTKYLFVESSFPNYPAKTAKLQSPCFNTASLGNGSFSFDYHMYGNAVGTLKLEKSTNGNTWVEVWSKSGNQGVSWKSQVVTVAQSSQNNLRFRFSATTGSNFQSDIAIDNIYYGAESVISSIFCPNIVGEFPYNESFENSNNNWEQDNTDDVDWTRKSGPTSSSNSGPSSAAHGSYYYYVEASSPNFPAKKAILKSPCLNLSDATSVQIKFKYHMRGNNMGSLSLHARSENHEWEQRWVKSGNQGDVWHTATIDLSDFAGDSKVKLSFNGITGSNYDSDIAIDDVRITTNSFSGACTAFNFSGQVNSYGGSQDAGTFGISDGGSQLNIYNNAWKSINLNYNVTSNTVLKFEFKSSSEGEVHGIGFDNNNAISSNWSFKVFGDQNWGIANYDNYSGNGAWKSYTIPVGNFYTGNFDRLVFICDNDSYSSGDNSFFRNVKVYENGICVNVNMNDLMLTGTALIYDEGESLENVSFYPNPVRESLNVEFHNQTTGGMSLRLFDITGKQVFDKQLWKDLTSLDVSNLPNGMYLIQLMDAYGAINTHKFVIAR